MSKGIDIAKWNEVTDYMAAKADGVEFAIVKVINKSNNPDSRFEQHMRGCDIAKIPVIGGYNYSYATNVSKAQADARAWLAVADGRIKICWLDIEDSSQQGLGQRLVNIINAYQDIIMSAGVGFGVYTGLYFYNTYIKAYADKIDCPFWIARYPSKRAMPISDNPALASTPSIQHDLIGWQYTSAGKVAGIKGNVDIDLWYRDINAPTVSEIEGIRLLMNPYPIPAYIVSRGDVGTDVMWVQWCLWRFGLLIDAERIPDETQIDGIFGAITESAVKKAQALLGAVADGVVGQITRQLFSKVL